MSGPQGSALLVEDVLGSLLAWFVFVWSRWLALWAGGVWWQQQDLGFGAGQFRWLSSFGVLHLGCDGLVVVVARYAESACCVCCSSALGLSGGTLVGQAHHLQLRCYDSFVVSVDKACFHLIGFVTYV